MIHYKLVKLKAGADVTSIYFRCRKVYAELEMELPFLHNAEVYRCEATRDSSADLMIIVHLDRPENLEDYLHHPKYLALMHDMKDYLSEWMSFDEREAI